MGRKISIVASWLVASCGSSSGDVEDSSSTAMESGSGSGSGSEVGTEDDDAATSAVDSDDGVDSNADESGPSEPGTVPMFVAQGHMGRTIVSCDDGRSWVGDRSNDDTVRCFEGFDCDHDAGAGRGIAWGDGFFVATFGWGSPGGLQRSADGFVWEQVLADTTFSGVAHGAEVFIAGSDSPRISTDAGTSWEPGGTATFSAPVRRFGFVPHDGGRFVLVGDSEIALSSDAGATWWTPDVFPEGCGTDIQTEGGIVYGNGTILVLGGDGEACTSSDGGQTFASDMIGTTIGSQVVFDGRQFLAWSVGTRWSSPDGTAWTSTVTDPPDLNLGPVAIGDSGTIVGVRGGWQTWYEGQAFYRSPDGVAWETLAAGDFVGSHPIRAMAFGYAEASEMCPAR